MNRYTYGPVPSRRLGRSLGVDVVPLKVCTYDCIYCQLGRTTRKTVERFNDVPVDRVVEEVEDRARNGADFITLSGSGEPTLCSRIGELIEKIKGKTSIPVAVLTNGSLLWRQDVRDNLMKADVVIPSLDAGDELMWGVINRPHRGLSFAAVVAGLRQFRRDFRGQYWLEVLLVSGYTAVDGEVEKIARLARAIGPDRIQVHTATRPPSEAYALPVPRSALTRFASMFSPVAELVPEPAGALANTVAGVSADDVLNLLRRRPCATEDVGAGLGISGEKAADLLEELLDAGLVQTSVCAGRVYYRPSDATATPH